MLCAALDLNIPPDNDAFASICRQMLNTCARNTEEAERAAKGSAEGGAASGQGLGKGVWGLIEESELTRSIRIRDGLLVKTDLLLREELLEQIRTETSRPSLGEGAGQGLSGSVTGTEQDPILRACEMGETLMFYVQSSATVADESKMERLLGLCDNLNG